MKPNSPIWLETIETFKKQPDKPKRRYNLLDKETLEHYYLDQHLTYAEIGELFQLSRQRICQLMKMYQIDRTYAERFTLECPQCLKTFETTRARYHGRAIRYCSTECYHADRKANYIPNRHGQRKAREAMETHFNRKLYPNEVVHHIDGNCLNNDISNLMLFNSHADHLRHHHLTRIRKVRIKHTA